VSEFVARDGDPKTAAGDRRSGQWRPIARAKTYELVLDRIEEQILTGELRVGDRLPPERDLATLLGVSRSAVREAIRALQAQGVLHSMVGNGPESGTIVSGSSGEALTRLLRLHVGLANFPIPDIVEARVMLERWSVKLAAANASPVDLERLGGLLAAMEDPEVERADFNDYDTAFHVAVAEAGGSRLVTDLTSAVRGSLRYSLQAAFEKSPDWASVVEGLRAEHRAIYDRIASGDGTGAADLIETHVRGFFGRLAALVPAR
jgi:GntR family transcriptional regulator, transcriptional repressor for pyruvate dehydrogenase complex